MQIRIKNLTKSIKDQMILKDINLEMESGKIYGIKGKNGSGKTMLMKAICGLIRPTSGTVEIDGEILGGKRSFPESVGALIEHPGFIPNYSGYDNLMYLACIRKRIGGERVRETMRLVGLDPDNRKSFKKYSLGMKQKLGIAAAIMENPDLIILDEPTNALDDESVVILEDILKNLKKTGKLVILSCHDTEELLKLSDIVFTMKEGRIT